jgi:hypothetical protein
MMGQMPQTYALPLDDVIQVLRATAGTGVYQVQAEVPAGLIPTLRRGHHALAEGVIQAGQPVSCVIREQGSNTILLEGANAFDAVRSRVQLVWTVRSLDFPFAQTPAAPQAGSATVAPAPPSLAGWLARPPCKRVQAAEQVRQITDRRHRLVWLLINGQRTLSDLAALLQMSPGDVQEALAALAAQGLIASEP